MTILKFVEGLKSQTPILCMFLDLFKALTTWSRSISRSPMAFKAHLCCSWALGKWTMVLPRIQCQPYSCLIYNNDIKSSLPRERLVQFADFLFEQHWKSFAVINNYVQHFHSLDLITISSKFNILNSPSCAVCLTMVLPSWWLIPY